MWDRRQWRRIGRAAWVGLGVAWVILEATAQAAVVVAGVFAVVLGLGGHFVSGRR